MTTDKDGACSRCERDMRHAHVRLTWDDIASPRFTYTLDPVGGDVYPSFARARKVATNTARALRADLKQCIDNLINGDPSTFTFRREPGVGTRQGTP